MREMWGGKVLDGVDGRFTFTYQHAIASREVWLDALCNHLQDCIMPDVVAV